MALPSLLESSSGATATLRCFLSPVTTWLQTHHRQQRQPLTDAFAYYNLCRIQHLWRNQSACAECSKEDCCKSSFVHLYIQFPTPRLSEREVWLPTMDSEDS